MYYRLLRLLSHNITPLFVFDGPHRPGFKRGHKKNTLLTPALIRLSKKLLKLFGCPFHTAPGEAEAECALLNRTGIVDAVLSEDVDTLMFGARTVIRKWSGEARNSSPTHVTVYDSAAIDAETGLHREGIVLVAMMRGGDYLPEGMPGCGIKTAVEAARAGFGDDLFAVRADGQRLAAWRERLQHELASNESGCFKRRNGRVAVPPAFPDAEILGFYAEPVVSDADTLARLRNAIRWDSPLDAVALREYARDTFEWRGSLGAAKFVRTLAPVLLAQKLWDCSHEAAQWVEGLHGRRGHPSTDGCDELRISYTPVHVIPIDRELEQEDDREEAREQAGVLDDDDAALMMNDGEGGKNWDPYATERIWMLEALLLRSIRDRIRQYDDAKASKAKPKANQQSKAPAAAPSRTKSSAASMDRFLKVSKHGGNVSPKAATPKGSVLSVAKRSASQALPKPKASGSSSLPAGKSRSVRAASSTYLGRNPPSPTKAPPIPPIPPRNPIAQGRRSDPPVRSPAKPLAGALSRAVSASVSSPAKISRTVSSPTTTTTRPSRTVSVSSPTKNPPLHHPLPTSPSKRSAGMRAVSATVSSRPTRPPPASPRKPPPPGSPRKPLEITREEEPEASSARRTGRVPAMPPYLPRSPSPRDGSPVGRLARAMETIDLRTPSPSRPSTPLPLQVDEVQFQSPTEGLLIWMDGIPTPEPLCHDLLPPVHTRAESTSRPRTPPSPPPQRPSPRLRRVASGTVAALVRNLETIAISSSPVLPETPPPPPMHAVPGRPVDFEAVQNSPNITIVRRRSRKPKARVTDKESPIFPDPDPPSSSLEDALAARLGHGGTVKVGLHEWAPGVWLNMDETDGAASAAAEGGCVVYEDVEVVDLTAV